MAYYRHLAENPVKLPNGKFVMYSPGTLSNWESDYIIGVVLMLFYRNLVAISGQTRKLNDVTIEQIYTLKTTFPKINATLIYKISLLKMD